MSNAKTISLLGATGSIGQATADIILSAPDQFSVQAVTANKNAAKLADLAKKLNARVAVVADESAYGTLKSALSGTGIEIAAGEEAVNAAAAEPADIVMAGIVGMAGLASVMTALEQGRTVAIANKEPLVAAGPLVMAHAQKHGATILPVDSEHNAVFQVFDAANRGSIEKIILTASGGPFRTWSAAKMAMATPEQAVAHPNWSMGAKISVDSASMMNKALEVIEAHYLFAMPASQIEVIVHPQSTVHAMVEYSDGSVLAQLGAPDMRTPIAHALAWPERMATPGRKLDWAALKSLDFEPVDEERFPSVRKAYECLQAGPWACVALNAANETAVAAFLDKRIGFSAIYDTIQYALNSFGPVPLDDLEQITEFDRAVRRCAEDYINKTGMKRTGTA